MESIDWTDVIEGFEGNENYILFVGPYAFQNEEGKFVEDVLAEELQLLSVKKGEHKQIKNFYKDDGLFFFEQGLQNRVARKIRKTYERKFQPKPKALQQIAQIPFSLIVNLTPSKFIQNAFRHSDVNLPFYHDFYDKSGIIQKEYINPTKEKPLIYNLLGNIGKEESLILTHDNLFDYLDSFFAKNKMHNDLKTHIQNAHYYIFLGLPTDKWYTQLLLRILKLNQKGKNEIERLATTHTDKNQVIYTDQFRFNIQDISVENFVDGLYKACEEEGLLKKRQSQVNIPTFNIDTLKEMLVDNEFIEAIESLENTLKYYQPRSNDLLSDLLMQKASLKTLESNNNIGIVTNYDIERRKLLKKFIDFLDDVVSQKEEIML